MSRHQQVQAQLQLIERCLKETELWQSVPPDGEAFASNEPFCVDTMTPLQWLQWVFLPRMQALLDAAAPLPGSLAIAPYYEVALESDNPHRTRLLQCLTAFDKLFEPTH